MGVGDILSRTFAVWGKNAVAYGLLGLIFGSPALIATILDPTYQSQVLGTIARVGGGLAGLVVSGAVTYGVFQQLRGEKVSLSQCVQVGLSRFVPIFLTGLLLGLALMVGFACLVIPGLILLPGLYVAVPVATVENPGPVDSLKRSWALTQGNKLNIFFAVLVMGLAVGLVTGVIAFIVAIISTAAMMQVVIQAISLFIGAVGGVMGAVVYHDLRVKKDGLATDDLVKVFQ